MCCLWNDNSFFGGVLNIWFLEYWRWIQYNYSFIRQKSMLYHIWYRIMEYFCRDHQNFGPCRPDGPTGIWQTLTLCFYLFLYFRELELTYRCKDCPGQDIWRPQKRISFMSTSFRPTLPPSLPHYPLQYPNTNKINVRTMYNYLLLVHALGQ